MKRINNALTDEEREIRLAEHKRLADLHGENTDTFLAAYSRFLYRRITLADAALAK